jgi:MerR family transcriptional regulator/heat shock protein HspR
MSDTILRREAVAEGLAIAPETLVRYERLGFIHCVESDGVVGYAPAEVRRIWSILSYQRDLGVNLAGVELILRLRDRMDDIHRRLAELARDLDDALDDTPGPDGHG